MVDINLKETDAIFQLRRKIEKIFLEDPGDHFLIRWLRARDLDVNKAFEMLKKHLEWKESTLQGIENWEIHEKVKRDIIYSFLGYDNDGSPVWWSPSGRYNLRTLIENGLIEDLKRSLYKMLEELNDHIEETRLTNGATQIQLILDFEGLTFHKVAHYTTMQMIVTFFREFEANYPELLKSVYLINVSWVFYYAFNIVKPFLSKATANKLQFFGKDRDKWTKALHGSIQPSILPEDYGGTAPPIEFNIQYYENS